MIHKIGLKICAGILGFSIITGSISAKVKPVRVEFERIEEKKLLSGKQVIKEDKAYMLLHANMRINGIFIAEPTPEQIELYGQRWAEQFEKANKKHALKLKRWSESKRGDPPVKPSAENFAIEPIQTWNMVPFGPQFVFNKDKSDKENPVFRYMLEVEPGNYVFHGPIFYVPGAAPLGFCFCMGSVQLDVKAGEITNLGNFLSNAPSLDNGGYVLKEPDPESKIIRWHNNPVEYPVPESLSSYKVTQAQFRPSGKMNNFLRVNVSRMGPVEGLFKYDRDQVIDLRPEAAVEGSAESTKEEAAAGIEPASQNIESAEGSSSEQPTAESPEQAVPATDEAANEPTEIVPEA